MLTKCIEILDRGGLQGGESGQGSCRLPQEPPAPLSQPLPTSPLHFHRYSPTDQTRRESQGWLHIYISEDAIATQRQHKSFVTEALGSLWRWGEIESLRDEGLLSPGQGPGDTSLLGGARPRTPQLA